jgi:arginine/lysine/ornithine decarboxylase
MALETLEGIEKIDGFKIVRKKPDDMTWDDFDKIRDYYPINITEKMNTISFKIQKGPIKEVGINGCQVDTMIETAKIIIEKFNEKYPCEQNYQAIGLLNSVVSLLRLRRLDRMAREVEGTSNP